MFASMEAPGHYLVHDLFRSPYCVRADTVQVRTLCIGVTASSLATPILPLSNYIWVYVGVMLYLPCTESFLELIPYGNLLPLREIIVSPEAVV